MQFCNDHSKTNLNSPELPKCYFIRNHKQIRSKEPIILYFVRPKRASGNCYVSYFLTEKTALHCITFLKQAQTCIMCEIKVLHHLFQDMFELVNNVLYLLQTNCITFSKQILSKAVQGMTNFNKLS